MTKLEFPRAICVAELCDCFRQTGTTNSTTHGARPSATFLPSTHDGHDPFGWKLFVDAQAFTCVTSTEKCSSDKSGATSQCAKIAAMTGTYSTGAGTRRPCMWIQIPRRQLHSGIATTTDGVQYLLHLRKVIGDHASHRASPHSTWRCAIFS